MLDPIVRLLAHGLPAPRAAALIRWFATRSHRPRLTEAQKLLMSMARRLVYGKRRRNVAWCWGESGPLVILVHGWNGRAAQLAPLGYALSFRGFQALAIEVTGHGDSKGSSTDWRHFIGDVSELAAAWGNDAHAFIGHSAGGLAILAARQIYGVRAARYVCICTPSHPYPPIRTIDERVAPPAAVLDACRQTIARQFELSWEALEAGQLFHGLDSDLLLVYDGADRYLDSADVERMSTLCPSAQIVRTKGYGHTRVLASAEVERATVAFLETSDARPSATQS